MTEYLPAISNFLSEAMPPGRQGDGARGFVGLKGQV
jgi:hypothetical protein